MKLTSQGPKQISMYFLAGVLAFWPLLGATLVFAFGDCRFKGEFYVYRSIGHMMIVATLLICAQLSIKTASRAKVTLSKLDIALIAIVGLTFIYTSLFTEPNYVFLIPSALIQLMAVFGIVACTSLFARLAGMQLTTIWRSIFSSMLLYLPVLFYIIFALPTNPDYHWSACFAPVQNLRWFGALLAIALAAGLTLPWPRKVYPLGSNWWIPVGLFILWTLLFWTGSRGQIIALFGAIIFLAVLSAKHRRSLFTRSFATAVPGLLVSAALPVPTEHFGFIQRLFSKGVGTPIDVVTSGRTGIWTKALNTILERPLLGHGVGQLHPATGATVPHAHNFPLEALMSFGVIGGGALIILVVKFYAHQIARARRHKFPDQITPPFLIFSTILLMSLVSGGVLLQSISPLLIIAGCGIWACLHSLEESNQQASLT